MRVSRSVSLLFVSLFLAAACAPAETPAATTPAVVTVASTVPSSSPPPAPEPAPAASTSAPAAPSSAPAQEASAQPTPIPCKSVDDCWFDDAHKPIARPKKLRGTKITPCKSGNEHAPACIDGTCVVRAFKC